MFNSFVKFNKLFSDLIGITNLFPTDNKRFYYFLYTKKIFKYQLNRPLHTDTVKKALIKCSES